MMIRDEHEIIPSLKDQLKRYKHENETITKKYLALKAKFEVMKNIEVDLRHEFYQLKRNYEKQQSDLLKLGDLYHDSLANDGRMEQSKEMDAWKKRYGEQKEKTRTLLEQLEETKELLQTTQSNLLDEKKKNEILQQKFDQSINKIETEIVDRNGYDQNRFEIDARSVHMVAIPIQVALFMQNTENLRRYVEDIQRGDLGKEDIDKMKEDMEHMLQNGVANDPAMEKSTHEANMQEQEIASLKQQIGEMEALLKQEAVKKPEGKKPFPINQAKPSSSSTKSVGNVTFRDIQKAKNIHSVPTTKKNTPRLSKNPNPFFQTQNNSPLNVQLTSSVKSSVATNTQTKTSTTNEANVQQHRKKNGTTELESRVVRRNDGPQNSILEKSIAGTVTKETPEPNDKHESQEKKSFFQMLWERIK